MKNAIKTQDFDNFTTKRATVTEIDDLLYKQFPVLDKGFVKSC